MDLLIVILILVVWAAYGIFKALTPSAPPIDDIDEHLKTIMLASNPVERRKILKK